MTDNSAKNFSVLLQELEKDPFHKLPKEEKNKIADEEWELFDQWRTKARKNLWFRFRNWLSESRFLWRLGKSYQSRYAKKFPERGEMLRKTAMWRLSTEIGGFIRDKLQQESYCRKVFPPRAIPS